MTPEEEAQIKKYARAWLRKTRGDEWVEEHAKFLDAEWEWIKQLGMIDPEVDLPWLRKELEAEDVADPGS